MSGVVSSAHPDAAALRSATALEEALQRGGLARRAEHTRRCAAVLKQLEAQFRAGGEARLSAMAVCQLLRHREALPLIRRGLRDADQVVAAFAADAMTNFRGRSRAPDAAAQPLKLPRNVSRMR